MPFGIQPINRRVALYLRHDPLKKEKGLTDRDMQVQPQPIPYVYAASPYGAPAYGTVAYQTAPLDVDWFNAWPRVRSILLAVAMLLSSAAVIGLDTTNIIIESNKPNGTSKIGLATGKVAAGIWCGSVSLAAAIFIIAIGTYLLRSSSRSFVLLLSYL